MSFESSLNINSTPKDRDCTRCSWYEVIAFIGEQWLLHSLRSWKCSVPRKREKKSRDAFSLLHKVTQDSWVFQRPCLGGTTFWSGPQEPVSGNGPMWVQEAPLVFGNLPPWVTLGPKATGVMIWCQRQVAPRVSKLPGGARWHGGYSLTLPENVL